MIAVVAGATYFVVEFGLHHNLVDRSEHAERSMQDELVHRGYHRILQYPEYLVAGAGEGGFDRFRTERGSRSIPHGGRSCSPMAFWASAFFCSSSSN